MMKKYIDPKILPLVKLMNRKGLVTMYSCAGFGASYDEDNHNPYQRHKNIDVCGSPYIAISVRKSNKVRLTKLLLQCIPVKTSYSMFAGPVPFFTIEQEQKDRVILRIPNEVFASEQLLKTSKSTTYSRRKAWLKRLEGIVKNLE